MSVLEIIAIWRKVKPWLDKPWVKALLSAVAAIFREAKPGGKIDTTPELPRNHPNRPRKWPDDWNSENDPA